MMWSCPKQVVNNKVWYLKRHSGVGPATESLDHRAGACNLLHGLSYDEHCHACWRVLILSSPLCIIECALHLVKQGLYCS